MEAKAMDLADLILRERALQEARTKTQVESVVKMTPQELLRHFHSDMDKKDPKKLDAEKKRIERARKSFRYLFLTLQKDKRRYKLYTLRSHLKASIKAFVEDFKEAPLDGATANRLADPYRSRKEGGVEPMVPDYAIRDEPLSNDDVAQQVIADEAKVVERGAENEGTGSRDPNQEAADSITATTPPLVRITKTANPPPSTQPTTVIKSSSPSITRRKGLAIL
ncbi:hypothetical protein BU26DRAFT_601675 [Trematosphaeria pertusa]|uniref:Uncharacterized protein n=1 Tax=Trematosphaeria pertusa TaxID=390896 RepID=A0A6A6ITD1_9PLEO|nr:uncharacterized protein BU26DRAFT_601675 [Trematosphaeria pertusa]KAF2253579.1 hypothetical protein BU26DRAFT_601675 [Trematosphaeria pertusa]